MANARELKADGFMGFRTVAQLRLDRGVLPKHAGVYAIIYPNRTPPSFLPVGTGSFHRGDPNVPVSRLEERWVRGPTVVYYGKADYSPSGRHLQKRLGEYLDFGASLKKNHWGGRLIWQLATSNDLVVCWKVINDDKPRMIEKRLIAEFAVRFGKQPFANIAS